MRALGTLFKNHNYSSYILSPKHDK